MIKKPKIIFVVNEDWAFMTLRLPMAKAALSFCGADGEVIIATNVNEHRQQIEDMGFRVVHTPFERGGINPFKELCMVWHLIKLFRKEQPDIIHTITLKPILDGSIAALSVPKACVINTFTGMGAVFISSSGLGLLRRILIPAFRLLMGRKNAHVIVQNQDDLKLLTDFGIARPVRTTLIAGSGVNIDDFPVTPEPPTSGGPIIVTMVARLLWDKGLGELIEAAQILSQRNCPVHIRIVGAPDSQNPQNVDENTLNEWKSMQNVTFLGKRTDIAQLWSESHIAVLPSYREGLPKSLLEAASCGRPMIATDVPGCRELVKDGENGLLIPVKDATALADAIGHLEKDENLRIKLGKKAREDVKEIYADTVVMEKTHAIYGDVFSPAKTN